MCYITESAIDHENDCLAKNNKECELCHSSCSELLPIEYCTEEEAMSSEKEGRECKTVEQKVCLGCHGQLTSDSMVVVV